jgi:hypothetical protein
MTVSLFTVEPNSITSPSTFSPDMDTFLSEFNPVIVEFNADFSAFNIAQPLGLAAAVSAAASAAAAESTANSSLWVTGTAILELDSRVSPITFLTYRANKDLTIVENDTDPSQEAADWVPLNKDNAVNNIGSTGGGTQDIDLTLGRSVTATVDTSANTFTFSNPTATGTLDGFILNITNGGSQTVAWPASVDWVAATAPTLTAAGLDTLVFITTDGGTTWLGFVSGQAIA